MKILFFCLFLPLFLISCGGEKEQSGKAGDITGTEAALKARVDSRWKEMKSLNFEKAYEYFSPEYRRLHTYKSFLGKVGDNVEWVSVIVDNIDISENYAKVRTKIIYRLKLPPGIGEKLGSELGEIDKIGKESWVWRSNQWWYADQLTRGL